MSSEYSYNQLFGILIEYSEEILNNWNNRAFVHNLDLAMYFDRIIDVWAMKDNCRNINKNILNVDQYLELEKQISPNIKDLNHFKNIIDIYPMRVSYYDELVTGQLWYCVGLIDHLDKKISPTQWLDTTQNARNLLSTLSEMITTMSEDLSSKIKSIFDYSSSFSSVT